MYLPIRIGQGRARRPVSLVSTVVLVALWAPAVHAFVLPPKGISGITARVIERLGPEVDRLVVVQTPRPTIPGTYEVPVKTRRADALDKLLYRFTLAPLFLTANKHIDAIGKSRIACVVTGYSAPVFGEPRDNRHFDATSVYIFEKGEDDPAQILWNALRTDRRTEVKRAGGVEVLLRKVELKADFDDFYYWTPQPYIAVVVRRGNLLEKTVERWNGKVHVENQFPWSLSEWGEIDHLATIWAIRRALEPKADRVNGAVLVVNPEKFPESIRYVWPGITDLEAEPAERDFPSPSEFHSVLLSKKDGIRPSVSIEIPLGDAPSWLLVDQFVVPGDLYIPERLRPVLAWDKNRRTGNPPQPLGDNPGTDRE